MVMNYKRELRARSKMQREQAILKSDGDEATHSESDDQGDLASE